MIQKSNRLLLSILFSLITNYLDAQYLIYPDSIPVQTIRVPLPYLKGGTIQDYFTDIQYLPLETKEKADVINHISDMVVNSNTIILHSNLASKNSVNSFISLYDTQGNLKRRLSTKDDFKSLMINEMKVWGNGFLVRTIHDAIEVEPTGHWNKTLNPINGMTDSLFMDTSTWYYQRFGEGESTSVEGGLYLDTVPYIRYNTNATTTLVDDLENPFSPYFKKVNAAYSTFPFSTEIFELSDKNIRKVYKFILPLDYTPDVAQVRSIQDKHQKKAFDSNYPNAVNGFDNVIRYKNYLLLQLKYFNGTAQWIALNFETEEIVDIGGLLPDISSDYMPIMGWQQFLRTDGEYLYAILYPNELVDRWSEKENIPFAERARLLSKSKNPILVKFKLK